MCVHSDSFHVHTKKRRYFGLLRLLCTLCTWFPTRKNAFEDVLRMLRTSEYMRKFAHTQ